MILFIASSVFVLFSFIEEDIRFKCAKKNSSYSVRFIRINYELFNDYTRSNWFNHDHSYSIFMGVPLTR